MKAFFTNMFKALGFKLQELPSLSDVALFAYRKPPYSSQTDYYIVDLVADLPYLDSRDGQIARYQEELEKLDIYEPSVDKNSSLILLYEKPDMELTKAERNRIISIEEDPYLFKKQIFAFVDAQLDPAFRLLEGKELIDRLQQKLNDIEAFSKFKEAPELATEYNFISKLFIKIPALSLSIGRAKLENLSERIELRSTENEVLHRRLLEKPSFEQMSDDALIQYLEQ